MIWLKRIALSMVSIIFLTVGIIYIFWMPVAAPQEPHYQLVQTWGEKGKSPGQLNEPTGIAASNDEVFVSDSRNSRIQVFDLKGNFKRQFGVEGKGKLERPMNISLVNQELYVADFFNDQIQVYALNGEFKRKIGRPGDGKGEFSEPGGVAVNADGDLYVADFYNQRVQQLKADGSFVRQWGQSRQAGVLGGKLNYPTDVAVNEQGMVYIADGYNDRILTYSPEGKLMYKWGGPFAINIFGPFNGWFATVTGLAVGPKGNVFVADFYNDRVQKFTAKGKFLTSFGINSTRPTHTAIAVTVADDGSVFVADYANHQVQKWQPDN